MVASRVCVSPLVAQALSLSNTHTIITITATITVITYHSFMVYLCTW